MDKAIGNLLVTLSFDSSKFNDGVTAAQRQLKHFERATVNAGKVARNTGYALDSSKIYVNNMKESYKALSHTLQEQKKQYDALGEAHGKDSAQRLKLGSQMELTKAKMIALNQEYQREITNIAKANSVWYQGFSKMEQSGSMIGAFGQKVQSLGSQWNRASLAAGLAGGLFIKSAMDFEAGMINVQKTTNLSDDELKKLGNTLRETARTMPITVAELQNLAMAGGQLGVAREHLGGFATLMAKVGTATDITSENAAEMFARFGNIANLPFDQFENLGSSLVHLGNNIAATESEIMNMAMGLAGTLSSIGVSNAEILGLSGSMAALGIESERGASSMSKFFVKLETMTQNGSAELQDFAKVAGMTADEFTRKYKEGPAEAFKLFVKGLHDIEKNGGSAVKTLDDLGVTEVRLRDTLLRLAQGYETLDKSMTLANEGWAKNSALQSEYENKLKSTQAQFDIFKNKLKDLAIEAGNALLPMANDLLKHSDGFINGIKNMVKWFSNLSDGWKKAIANFALSGIVFGPILTAFGSIISLGGTVVSTLAKIGKFFALADVAKIKKGFGDLGTEMTSNKTIMETFGGVVSTFGRNLMSLNPTTLLVTGAVVAGTIAWKTWGEEAHRTFKRLQEFPDLRGITEEQATSLRRMKDETSTLNTELQGLGKNTNIENVNRNLSSMADEIKRLNTEKIERLREAFSKLPKDVQESLAGSLEATIKNIEQQTERVDQVMKRMEEISKKTLENNGKIPAEYLSEVQGLTQEMMGHYAVAITDTAEEADRVYSNLTKKISTMNHQELTERRANTEKIISSEKQKYEELKEAVFQFGKETGMSRQQINAEIEKLQSNHNARMLGLYSDLIRSEGHLMKEQAEKTGEPFEKGMEKYEMFIEKMMQKTGLAREQIEEIWNNPEIDFDKIEQQVLTAQNKLNQALSESKINVGEINTDNIQSFIEHAKQAGMTWEEIELLSKNTRIDSNTREFLQAVLETKSQWDYLTFDEKVAKIQAEGKEAIQEMLSDVEAWNGMTAEEKEAILSAVEQGDRKISDILLDAGLWNQLTFNEQMAILKTEGHADLESLLKEYNVWQTLPEEVKQALVETNADEKQAILDSFYTYWNSAEFQEKLASINVEDGDAKTKIGNFLLMWLTQVLTAKPANAKLNATDEATSKVNAAKEKVDLFGKLKPTPTLNATDNASDKVSKVKDKMNALNDMRPTPIVGVTDNASSKVDSVQGKVDKLGSTHTNSVLRATDSASSVISSVKRYLWSLDGQTANTYVYTHHISKGVRRLWTGTPYHTGGLAVLGDGGRPEPYLTPSGHFGVSPDHDTLYDLPMGTKVWSSVQNFMNEWRADARLRDIVPGFSKGTDKSFLDGFSKIKVPTNFGRQLEQVSSNKIVHEGDSITLNVTINPIGSRLSSQQADGMIDQIMESAQRWGAKHNKQIIVGR